MNSASETLRLCVQFSRAPANYPELLRGASPLPREVGLLLRVAGGASCADLGLQGLAPAEDAETRKAARFFVEEVMLAPDADLYRLLGVERGASVERMKEHHRLLMRIFHPDREELAASWKDSFATRINLAYNTLRSPESRAAYDASLQRRGEDRRASPPALRTGFGAMPQATAWLAPGWVVKWMPQMVLGVFAVLASIGVLVVYLEREPAGAIGSGNDDEHRHFRREATLGPPPAFLASQGATSQGATSQGATSQGATSQGATSQGATSQGGARYEGEKVGPVADLKPRAMNDGIDPASASAYRRPLLDPSGGSPTAPDPVRAPDIGKLEPKQVGEAFVTAIPTSAGTRETVAASKVSKELRSLGEGAGSGPLATGMDDSAVAPERSPVLSLESGRAAAATGTEAAERSPKGAAMSAPTGVHSVASVLLRETGDGANAKGTIEATGREAQLVAAQKDRAPDGAGENAEQAALRDLVNRLMACYSRGSIECLMALFDEEARIERGGKDRIRTDYSELFSNTEGRQLYIWDLRWVRDGEAIRGDGQFQARVIRSGEAGARVYEGTVVVEVVQRNRGMMIRGLFHTLAPRK